jgi:starch phosphorylase
VIHVIEGNIPNVSENQPFATTLDSLPADETPSVEKRFGPEFAATHPLAVGPVVSPPHSVDGFVKEFLRELNFGTGVLLSRATVNDQYVALARTVAHYLAARWLEGGRTRREAGVKMVGYLSAEYLLGRQLGNALLATGLRDIVEEGLESCGINLSTLRAQEVEPGLGNGGLGRLAACFIDSLATINVPCIGYGIRYEYGIFRQTFVDGRQVEQPDLALPRLAVGVPAPGGGRAGRLRRDDRGYVDEDGTPRRRWLPSWNVLGSLQLHGPRLPQRARQHPAPMVGPGNQGLRPADLQLRRLRRGGAGADLRREHLQGALSRGLHPAGPELRLQQQYFFVACSLRDFIERELPAGLRSARPARADHLPAQRHPPGDRGPGAHAAARR